MNAHHNALKQSEHVKSIDIGQGNWIQYHRLFGNPMILTERDRDIFLSFPPDSQSISSSFKANGLQFNRVVHTLEQAFHLVADAVDERAAIKKIRDDFAKELKAGDLCNALSLVVTEGCNFKCKHCLPKQVADLLPTYPLQQKNMAFSEAKSAIDDFVSLMRLRDDTPQIYFGGREPLANWKVVEQALEYASERFRKLGKTVMFIMFTNCSLLTEEIVEVLKKHEVLIAISMDGTKDINDRRRPTPSGKGSFDLTLRGWNLLRNAGLLDRCFNCTVGPGETDVFSEEFLEFADGQGFSTISINPDETTLTPDTAEMFLTSLIDFYDKSQSRNIRLGGQWRMVFESLFRNVSNSINTGFCSAYTGHSVAVRPGGNYSLCSPDSKPISEPQELKKYLASDAYSESIMIHFVGEIDFCIGCDIEGFCMGGCGVAEDVAIRNGADPAAKCVVFRGMFEKLLVEAAITQLSRKEGNFPLPLPLEGPF